MRCGTVPREVDAIKMGGSRLSSTELDFFTRSHPSRGQVTKDADKRVKSTRLRCSPLLLVVMVRQHRSSASCEIDRLRVIVVVGATESDVRVRLDSEPAPASTLTHSLEKDKMQDGRAPR